MRHFIKAILAISAFLFPFWVTPQGPDPMPVIPPGSWSIPSILKADKTRCGTVDGVNVSAVGMTCPALHMVAKALEHDEKVWAKYFTEPQTVNVRGMDLIFTDKYLINCGGDWPRVDVGCAPDADHVIVSAAGPGQPRDLREYPEGLGLQQLVQHEFGHIGQYELGLELDHNDTPYWIAIERLDSPKPPHPRVRRSRRVPIFEFRWR